jgi:hypothetical protein
MIARCLGALLAALLFAMPAGPAWADVTGTVRGTVTIDGTAAAGARVTIAGEGTTSSAFTDAQGRFAFTQIAFGRYVVRAESAGRPAAQAAVDVSTDSVSNVVLAIGATA